MGAFLAVRNNGANKFNDAIFSHRFSRAKSLVNRGFSIFPPSPATRGAVQGRI